MFKHIFKSKNWKCAYHIGYLDGQKGCLYEANPFLTPKIIQNKLSRAWTKGWL